MSEAELKLADERRPDLVHASLALLSATGEREVLLRVTYGAHVCGLFLAENATVGEEQLEHVFEIVSLKRELESGRLDKYGRTDERTGVNLSDPWVSKLASSLLSRAGWRRRKSFSILFTHDVDHVTSHELLIAAKLLLPHRYWIRPSYLLDPAIVEKAIRWMIALEHEYGARGLYFFLSSRYGLRPKDNRYDIRWQRARRCVRAVREAGMITGLHGSFKARDRDSYGYEARLLEDVTGEPTRSHRNHYLRIHPRLLAYQMEAAGIARDYSIGWPSRTGFRAGLAHPVPLYNWQQQKTSTVWSVPLVYMENQAQLIEVDRMFSMLHSIFDSTRAIDGAVSILIHPSALLQNERWQGILQRLLALAVDMGAEVDAAGHPLPKLTLIDEQRRAPVTIEDPGIAPAVYS